MLAMLGGQFYVGPDNGTITAWLEICRQSGLPARFYHLDRPAYWLANVTHVFHGRDIFAPVAAHLARGVPPEDLGTPFDEPVLLALPQPEHTAAGWLGEVVHIDNFGNLIVNITPKHLDGKRVNVVRLNGAEIPGLVNTFGERPNGALAALIGSSGDLVVAEVNGSAAARLNARVGDLVEVVIG
jgi:S-adenosylmethionine hydrolase